MTSFFPKRHLVGMIAETHIHAGIGQVAGAIDLPVARMKHNGAPYLPASGFKGALRDMARIKHPGSNREDSDEVNKLFGPEKTGGDDDAAGGVVVEDAHVLCLPARALGEPFRWLTSVGTLTAFHAFLTRLGAAPTWRPPGEVVGSEAWICNPPQTQGQGRSGPAANLPKVRLEEFLIQPKPSADLKSIAAAILAVLPDGADAAFEAKFINRIMVVSEPLFDHLCAFALPVRQRNALEKGTKKVKDGMLWSEEYLAPETLLYSAWADRFLVAHDKTEKSPVQRLQDCFTTPAYMQLGGKETIGCGWVKLAITELPAPRPRTAP